MSIKSINLLPEVFRSKANQKFLAATLDQLISESTSVKLDSYIGRVNAPTWKLNDTYVTEPSANRQNYQLEASVVVDQGQGITDFYSSYVDLLQQIEYAGGNIKDHSRLFTNTSYNFDGVFDFDKFVNFTQYVWLPNGPPKVTITASAINSALEYIVARSTALQSYQFSEYGNDKNPIINLIKGNTYKFHVNQPGFPFWIQTRPGVTGSTSQQAEQIARSILGLDNNGIDQGTLTFTVPLSEAQDNVVNATTAATVDLATEKSYYEIQSHLTFVLSKNGGIDGVTDSLDGKTLIFVNANTENSQWTDPGNFDYTPYDSDSYEAGTTIGGTDRFNVFRIRTVDVGGGRRVVRLEPTTKVDIGQKVYVRSGNEYANVSFLKNPAGFFEIAPPVTAPLAELYYQDGTNPEFFGTIRLVNPGTETINIDTNIVGQKSYTSPNRVSLSNGLLIEFDNTVIPAHYANNSYIVEGVGKAIKLINIGNFAVPEKYATVDRLTVPDYITVNRASADLNAWSRSNRWFHIQTVEAAAGYRNDPALLDLVGVQRGRRPIIEFEPDIYLYEYGRQAKSPVDVLDFTVTDAFAEVEGKSNYVMRMPNGITKQLTAGTRIIFANDTDPEVRKRIYRIENVTTTAGTVLHLASTTTLSLPTYTVTGAKITSNLTYNFVPAVSFTAPLPGIGTITTQGKVVLKSTGLANIAVSYTGINYIADPYIMINSAYTTQANTDIVYRPYKSIDYIRIDNRGTAYIATSPNVSITNPNRYFATVSNISLGATTFKLTGVTSSQWLGITPGTQVIGNGIVGGTIVQTTDVNANLVTLSAPVITANLTVLPQLVGISTVNVADTWTFKSNVDPGTYAVVASTVRNSSVVTVNDTSMIDNGMIMSGGVSPVNIASIRIDVVPTRVITSTAHGLVSGDLVLLRGIAGTIELNNARYYVSVPVGSTTAIDLYSAENLASTAAQDSRNFSNYRSGGTITSYTVDYGLITVSSVNSPTQFTTNKSVTLKAGTKLVFAGVRATATARSDGNGIYTITVGEPGSGYATTPNITIDSSAGNQANAAAVMSENLIQYITVTDPGTGYRTNDALTATIISQVNLVTSKDTVYGTNTLFFNQSNDLSAVQPGWLVMLEVNDVYTDFSQTPYAETAYSGPNPDTYNFFMDVTKTRAIIRRVQSVSGDGLVLTGAIYSKDSDGEIINLPAGSKIFVTAQNRFFTVDGYGSSPALGSTTKKNFLTTAQTVEGVVVALNSVLGLQPGMLVQDSANILSPAAIIKSVDAYTNRITLATAVTLAPATLINFLSNSKITVKLNPSTVDYIDITEPGFGYTSAPVLTIDPTVPVVTKLVSVDPTDPTVLVLQLGDTYAGIPIGAEVTSDYDYQGLGVTTGNKIPLVKELFQTQINSTTFQQKIRLSTAQPAFSGILATFTYAAKGLSTVEITNSAIDYLDITPETYDVGDTVLVNIPSSKTQQLLTNVLSYNQFYYDGIQWLEAQQKTDRNQEPLYDVFDRNGKSAGDGKAYTGTKFTGTKIFGYTEGTGVSDDILGFPLAYKNFQNVGDIQFTNYFQTDSFSYLNGFAETPVRISPFVLKQHTGANTYKIRNSWTPVVEKSKQYQTIVHSFDGSTNYFEIDILPVASKTVPYLKVYVGAKRLNESTYRVAQVGGRTAVVIDIAQLDIAYPVHIKIYSKQQSTVGFYETPSNSDFNPLNSNFEKLTLGQVRNHLVSMIDNHYGVVGATLGRSNLRDLDIKTWQGSILQHASPVTMASLFLVDPQLNAIQAIEFAQKEYTKFKYRFLDAGSKLQIDPKNIPGAVDTIMASITLGKNSMSPWYNSDMVPYGDKFRKTTILPILDTRQRTYLIPSTFDPTVLSQRAVLVYQTDPVAKINRQLVRDIDFVFNTGISSITLADHIPLAYTQKILIVDYTNTVENYIPETPTKLGLYPKFTPCIIEDNTYSKPVRMIQGHDGSLTPTFDDLRDQLLLELELRIYNNIKINYENTLFEMYDTLPGRYRANDYSREEFDQLLTRTFLGWVGNNRLDYTSNTYFESGNPWSWNYRSFHDAAGTALPGYWRGIFKYFYDTDRPHATPWEMLGFSEEPIWWKDSYGPAPYTSGNRVLWEDLERGYITKGNRQGYDSRFARPGLTSIIPVDENGRLLDPMKLMVAEFDSSQTAGAFVVGDHGPVETAWRKSSDFPYAMQIALILARPAFYLGTLFDNSRYHFDTELGQITSTDTRQRIIADLLQVPESGTKGSAVVLTAGYSNFVRDYLIYQGIDGSSKMRDYLLKLDVRLSYKVAGFSDKKMLEVIAEQSSPGGSGHSIIIPNENYRVYNSKGSPLKRLVYSAVIVEKSNKGWKVSGYDTIHPYFTIVPVEFNNNAYGVKEIDVGVTIYKDFKLETNSIPYGHEFANHQELANFFSSYGHYLESIGFVFDKLNDALQLPQDWNLSIREFLTWSQQGWQEGSVLVVGPAGSDIKIESHQGVVDHITNRSTGSRMLDQNFALIKGSDYSVTREDGIFTVECSGSKMIALADFDLIQYEHALIFDNTTVFNDVMYQPEIGNRQYRLKLRGFKSGNWEGQLSAPGFIYNNDIVDEWKSNYTYDRGSLVAFKNQYYLALEKVPESNNFNFIYWRPIDKAQIKTGLLPNFSNNADKSRYYYDPDQLNRDNIVDQYSTGLIGFRKRGFLQDLGIDDRAQLKFYQGYIKQKGTKNAIDALTAGQFDRVTSQIDVYEEWGLRVGEYGATGSDQYLEVTLDEQKFTNDPTTFVLLDRDQADLSGVVNFNSLTIYRTSEEVYNKNIIKSRLDKIPRIGDNITAGYPRLDDIDGTIYDINKYQNYSNLVATIGAGYKLWTAVDFNQSWNIYRATETDVSLVSVSRTASTVLLFTFGTPHGSRVNDFIAIKNFFDQRFDGFYRIVAVLDNLSFTVNGYKGIDTFAQLRSIDGTGVFLRMKSVRFTEVGEIINFVPPHGWRNQDRAWIDSDTANGVWGVYQKTDGWNFASLLPLRLGEDRYQEGYGSEVRLSIDNIISLAGTSAYTAGSLTGLKVINPGSNYSNPYVQISYPTGTNGVQASFVALKDNGKLILPNLIASGYGYTFAPNITITDQWSTTTTDETSDLNVPNYIFFASGDENHIYIGDFVSGKGIPYGTQVIEGPETTTHRVHVNSPNVTQTATNSIPLVIANNVTFNVTLDASVAGVTVGGGIRAYPTGYVDRYLEGYVVSYIGTVLVANMEIAYGTTGGTYGSWLIVNRVTVRTGTPVTFYRGTNGVLASKLAGTSLDYIEVIDGGSGFVLQPQVDIIGGGGIGARAVAVISGGQLTSIRVTNGGSGYTETPDIFLLTNNATPVVLQPRLTQSSVDQIIVTNQGLDYKEPVVTITADTRDRATSANLSLSFYGNGGISSMTVTNGGKSYGNTTVVSLYNSATGSGFVGNVSVGANGVVYAAAVISPGTGYNTSTVQANVYYGGGRGAQGNVGRTTNGIGAFAAGQVVSYGQGYLEVPTVTVIDLSGTGSGAVVEPVMPTGQVKSFLRPDQNTTGLEETQLIKPFSSDAREFGYSVDMGSLLAAIGAPGSFTNRGGVLVCQTLGAQWISYQMIYPYGLVVDARFGHSVAMSSDQQWIYVGAPGMNRVYCYGRKVQSYARVTLVPSTNQTSYTTNLLSLQSPTELKVLGSDGKIYEPGFDYTVSSDGVISFADYARIASQAAIYISRQRLQTTLIPTVLRGIVQRTYALKSRPETIDQLLVYGATGRVFVPNLEYTVIGSNVVFLDDTFLTEPSIVINQRDTYYQLVDTLVPPETVNANAKFGWSVKTDLNGYSIVVGAPAYAALDSDGNTIPAAGRAYVFARSYEVVLTLGDTSTFTLASLRSVVAVSIDSILLTNLVDYVVSNNSIQLNKIPRNGARIKIDTNYFNILQILPCESVVNQGKYGATVDISPDNKSIIIGSPGYRDADYYNGAVYRYVNKGLFYGTVNTEKNYLQANVNLGDSIKINDKTVTFTSITPGVTNNSTVAFSTVLSTISLTSNVGLEIGDRLVTTAVPYEAAVEIVAWSDSGQFSSNVVLSQPITLNRGDKLEFRRRGDNINKIKRNIDAGGAVAVSATITDNNHLTIALSGSTSLKTLDILPGTGTALLGIGLKVYQLTQTLYHPRYGIPERFGTKIVIDNTGETIAISSEGGNTLKTSTFDKTTSLFDKDTTRFIDSLNASGAVYIYDYLSPPGETLVNPGKLLYNQVLQDAYVLTGDNFGSAIDLNNGWALVGADRSDYTSLNAGAVHLFTNLTNTKGWSRLHERSEQIDIDYINRALVYNKTQQVSLQDLDYFDPAKGKILGIADQDLDYKSLYDPAFYNRGTSSTVNLSTDSHWGSAQEGQTWWDLSLCRYINYEQDDPGSIGYRSKHWGQLFPGSVVQVAEWVGSAYLPSQYQKETGDGQAKYPMDSAYTQQTYLDTQSGVFKTRYYYWVINKKLFDRNATKRNNSIVTLEAIIKDPQAQGIPYMAAIASNAFNVYNIRNYLSSTNSILRLEYSRVLAETIAHNEYELIQQNNPDSFVPVKLINKLIDSLSGENSTGSIVPDLKLSTADAYGISNLPRQSMIKNSLNATKVFVTFVNNVLATKQVSTHRNFYRFQLKEAIPPVGTGFYHLVVDTVDQLLYIPATDIFIGYKVLVNRDSDYLNYWTIYEYQQYVGFRMVRIQSYDTTRWWDYMDWYKPGYDEYVNVDFIVPRYVDIYKLEMTTGQTVKVLNTGNGYYSIYIMNAMGQTDEVVVERGTIQLSTGLYDPAQSRIGFDNAAFDQVGFSTTQNTELRNLFEGLVNDIFINEDLVETNKLFFTMLNYILSEQLSVDWAIKTSLISVTHRIRKLEQFTNYIKDNQTYYEDYINEVKPYRTQIREYLLDYQGLDKLNTGLSDFDFPSLYDTAFKEYRVLNQENARDLALINSSSRRDWLENYAYQIQDIVLIGGGKNYTNAPRIVISGGGGTGATATSSIFANGVVSSVTLTSHGSGYTSTPQIELAGGNGTGATARVIITQDPSAPITPLTLNKKVRSILTKLRFDRVNYNSSVRNWKPYNAYHPGDLVVIDDVRLQKFTNYSDRELPRLSFVYRVTKTLLGRNTIDLNLFQNASIVQKLSGSDLETANDRIASYLQPGNPNNARIYSSPNTIRLDSSTINDQIVSTGKQWNAVTHSVYYPDQHHYQYAAVGDSTLISVSTDGKIWTTSRITDSTVNCRDVFFYRNYTWVAVGNQGSLFLSDDGVNWNKETITQFRYNPSGDTIAGKLQENTAQILDMTSGTSVRTTYSDYIVVVGNNDLILANPNGNSAFKTGFNQWMNVKIQNQSLNQSYLKVVSVDRGYLTDITGTTYDVEIQSVSGYFVQSTNSAKRKMKVGVVFTIGVNGAINVITYNHLDDYIQGFISGYNYNSGKAGDVNYPWQALAVPATVAGAQDGFSGEQLTSLAVSGTDTNWIVTVGSSGTLLWNQFNLPIEVQTGRAELSPDTINKTVVNHGYYSFENFRNFDDTNFVAPLTKDRLAKIDFNDITWDGEKFVVVGGKGTILWGYPGVYPGAYIELGNQNPSLSIISRRESASWGTGTGITQLTISIPVADINAAAIATGMLVSAGGIPADAVVSTVTIGVTYHQIVVAFASTNIVSRSAASISFSYGINSTLASGATVTASNGTTSITLTLSQSASRGSTRLYVSNYKDAVQSNWTMTGTGIPAGTRIRYVGKFANFNWQLAPGVTENINLEYRAVSVNTTTLTISQPLMLTNTSVAGAKTSNTVTFYRPDGTTVQLPLSQDIAPGATTLAFASIRDLEIGYVLQANLTMGIRVDTTITSLINYNIGGVVSGLEKDIPSLVPGTGYPGSQVLGQPFTETATDALGLDSSITSEFSDNLLGQRPEDIIVDGGKFIDTYSSHAPEELVPGQVIDSLQMNIFTANVVNGRVDFGNVIAYKVFTDYKLSTSYYRLSDSYTTALAQDFNFTDASIAVTDIAKLPDRGSIWINAEKINYLEVDRVNGLLKDLRRGALRTSISSTHSAGSLVTDATEVQLMATDFTTAITEDTTVQNGIVNTANSSTYLSSVSSTIPQGSIWIV